MLAYYCAKTIELVNPDPTDITSVLSPAAGRSDALTVDPNTARERVQVVLPDTSPGQLELGDVSGRVLRSWRTGGHMAVVDLAVVSVGVYLIRWHGAEGGSAVAWMVKE